MSSSGKSQKGERLSAEYLDVLYKRHFQGALVRCGTSVAMWLLALGAFSVGLINKGHIAGVSASVLYLILINPPALLAIKRITSRGPYRSLSFLINMLEIIGYTAVIYFLGGIEAVYLTPMYAALITYIGVVSPRRIPFFIAGMCSGAFGLMVYLEYSGVIPAQRVSMGFVPSAPHLVSRVSAVACLLFIVAYISSYTSAILKRNRDRLRKQNLELQEKAKRIEKTERELRNAHQGLEKRVEERTQELLRANKELKREIQDRKRAEKALKDSEEKYRYIFENVSDFLCFHDMEGNLIEMNWAFKNAYGFEGSGNPQLNIRDMIVEEFKGQFDDYMKRIREKRMDEGVMKIKNKQGDSFIIEYKASLVYDPKGLPVGVHGSGRDITERIKMAKEKKKLQAQLMHAQRLEAIGTLAGGVAHNFNNLLMGIQGNASVASLKVDSESPAKKKLENIERLVKRGSELTEQLLGYAREVKYEAGPLDLNKLVNDTADTFGRTRKDIVIHKQLAEDLLQVKVDQTQMEQVLLNLYVNAAEAMQEGGEVFLETKNVNHKDMSVKNYEAKQGTYVWIKVRDTGPGMDEETKERAFEPFFTSKDFSRGTGLGLASAYGIVKAHGGEILIQSEIGKGSTFEIYLPAYLEQSSKEKTVPKTMGKSAREERTVLFVDDEEMILEAGKEMLEEMGYRVLTAGSGEEALALNEKEDVDAVILDIVMPGLGGKETFKRLKESEPEIKVILSSGYRIDEGAEELFKQGCQGFIQKPFDISELSKKLERVFSRL